VYELRTKRAFTVHHFLERCSIKVCYSNLLDQALVPELGEPLGDLQGCGAGDLSGLWGTGLERESRQEEEEEGCKVCGRGEGEWHKGGVRDAEWRARSAKCCTMRRRNKSEMGLNLDVALDVQVEPEESDEIQLLDAETLARRSNLPPHLLLADPVQPVETAEFRAHHCPRPLLQELANDPFRRTVDVGCVNGRLASIKQHLHILNSLLLIHRPVPAGELPVPLNHARYLKRAELYLRNPARARGGARSITLRRKRTNSARIPREAPIIPREIGSALPP